MTPEERLYAAAEDFFGDFCPLVAPASRLEHGESGRSRRQCPRTRYLGWCRCRISEVWLAGLVCE